MTKDDSKSREQLFTEVEEARRRIAELEASRRQENNHGLTVLLFGELENPFCSLFVKDLEGRFIFYNEQTAQSLRVSKSEILAKTDHDFLPKNVADAFRN